MGYDRYLAICHPLRYTSIMDYKFQIQLVTSTWLVAFIVVIFFVLLICNLHFCGPRIIDHYFCDVDPLLKLSCLDPSTVKLTNFILTILFAVVPFSFILFTYISIFISIFGISSNIGKQKAFSTCSSHLIVVSTYYGTIITVYMIPSKAQSYNINKFTSLLYTTGTPFLNPIIYSLRNHDLKIVVMKYIYNSLTRN
ncbi:olfactory receptor 1E16-like [Pelodytes ibericus]